MISPGAKVLLATLWWLAATVSQAVELVSNGSFESNSGNGSATFSNWTVVRENLDGTIVGNFFANNSTRSPLFRLDVPAAPVGSFTAMTDQSGPGRTAIYQNVAVPSTGAVWLNLRLLVINQANDFVTLPTLDLSAPGNQQVRVDVMTTSSALWDTTSGVLTNVYRSMPGDLAAGGFVPMSINLRPFAGSTVRIRVAEVDNLHGMVVGVDQVSATHVPSGTCAPVRPREGNASCNLDIDGDGLLTTIDALIATRYLLGFRNASLPLGITFSACATNTSASGLNAAASVLATGSPPVIDIDGDGVARGPTDGLLLLRGLRGLTGAAATTGAIAPAPAATRSTWATARKYLNSNCLAGVL